MTSAQFAARLSRDFAPTCTTLGPRAERALEGRSLFKFAEAISLLVGCERQEEADALSNKRIASGASRSER